MNDDPSASPASAPSEQGRKRDHRTICTTYRTAEMWPCCPTATHLALPLPSCCAAAARGPRSAYCAASPHPTARWSAPQLHTAGRRRTSWAHCAPAAHENFSSLLSSPLLFSPLLASGHTRTTPAAPCAAAAAPCAAAAAPCQGARWRQTPAANSHPHPSRYPRVPYGRGVGRRVSGDGGQEKAG